MIRSLRRKFIFVAMASLITAMSLIYAAISIGTYYVNTNQADGIIQLLEENGGEFPLPGVPAEKVEDRRSPVRAEFQNSNFHVRPESRFETRYFVVEFTAQQEVREVNMNHIAAFDRSAAIECVEKILEGGKKRGYEDYYRYGVFDSETGGSTIIVLDCFLQRQMANRTSHMVMGVFLICAVIVFFLLLVLSGRVIRPFIENLERQRQFITDASHELKTPLAILSADMSLLGDTCGENQWLDSAKTQIQRLDKLTKSLVELAQTEEVVKDAAMTVFSLSDVAQANVDAFTPLAEAAGKTLEAELELGIDFRGVEDNLFRLFSILLDNAVKYCDPGGIIRLRMKKQGRTIHIVVSNPCEGLDPAQLGRYFDRFYRADSSRARATGGYGIGLSTAKAIVLRYRGRIDDRYANGVISFSITLPCV